MAADHHRDEGRFARDTFAAVAVECEIAVWIGRDMGPAGAPYDRDSAAEYVAACSAAMEIVDNRYGSRRVQDVFGYEDGWSVPGEADRERIREIMNA